MGAYFGQGVVNLLNIWSTIKKSSTLLAKKINSPAMGTETSLEKDTGSSYVHEMLLLAIRRRRKLVSGKLRNQILRTRLWIGRRMQMTTWFFKKGWLNAYFGGKNKNQEIQSQHLNLNISGASGKGRASPTDGVRWITSCGWTYDSTRELGNDSPHDGCPDQYQHFVMHLR